jgi:hypothetical protein
VSSTACADQGANQCNILKTKGTALIGGSFVSGSVNPAYNDAPAVIKQEWGASFLVGLGLLTLFYFVGGMVCRPPAAAACCRLRLIVPSQPSARSHRGSGLPRPTRAGRRCC